MSLEQEKDERDFLSRQLIAYIGNKRRLLHFVKDTLDKTLGSERGGFLDLFAGSGSVSRLAKVLGFSVVSNDWEFYSFIINQAYIGIDQRELQTIFENQGGLENALKELNSLTTPREPYLSLYYAPRSKKPDPDVERMFYTPENARKIDAIRERIDEWFPVWDKGKYLLTALVVYYAATHTNTSGVFKAYHRGFGGHGKDALQRILKPIELEEPVLIDSHLTHRVYQKDANDLVRELDWDNIQITYLDPPYNQHQYGSNYHLLNTIALWDKPLITNVFSESGKAGIRKDWPKTRSDYCMKEPAKEKFRDLIGHIKSRFVILSYNTEGVIPLPDILQILKEHGKVKFYTDKYVKYRGGRQSLNRRISNLEFLIVLDRQGRQQGSDDAEIKRILEFKQLEILKNSVINIKTLEGLGWVQNGENWLHAGHRITLDEVIFVDYEGDEDLIYRAVAEALICSKDEEIEVLLSLNPKKFKNRIFTSFKKIAHTKYEQEFQKTRKILVKHFGKDKIFQQILLIAKRRGLIID